MRNFLTGISFLLLMTPVLSHGNTAPLTLSRAISEAMKYNPELHVFKKSMESSKALSDAPLGGFDTMLEVESQRGRSRIPSTSNFVPETATSTNHRITLMKRLSVTGGTVGLSAIDKYTSNEYSATQLLTIGSFVGVPKYHESEMKLVYEQPLLKGLFASDIKEKKLASDSAFRATKEMYFAKADNLVIEVSDKYWNTLLAGESMQIRKNALDRSEKFLNLVNKRLKLGTAEKLDQLQAKASNHSNRENLILAELDNKKSRRALDVTIGKSLGSYSISSAPLSKRLYLAPKHNVVEKAISSRRDLKSKIELLNRSEALANAAKENQRPSLNAFGSYQGNGLSDSMGTGMNDALRFKDPSWMVGIRLTTPLGNTTANAELEAQRADVLRAKAEIHKYQMLVRQNAEDIWDSVVAAQKSLTEAEKNLEIQKSKLTLAEKRFRQGRASSKLIIDFQNELNFTELDVLRKKARLQKTYTALQVIQGEYQSN